MTEAHFRAPATIVSYDPTTQSASVQPSLMRKYNGPAGVDIPPVALPQINLVPVVFPGSRTSWLRFPLYPGDPVMLHFSDRSLDLWWTQGGMLDPAISHKFSLADAICVPGLRSKSEAIQPKGLTTSLELVNGPTRIEIMAGGQVAISNGVVELLQSLLTFATGLNDSTLTAQAAALVTALTPLVAP